MLDVVSDVPLMKYGYKYFMLCHQHEQIKNIINASTEPTMPIFD